MHWLARPTMTQFPISAASSMRRVVKAATVFASNVSKLGPGKMPRSPPCSQNVLASRLNQGSRRSSYCAAIAGSTLAACAIFSTRQRSSSFQPRRWASNWPTLPPPLPYSLATVTTRNMLRLLLGDDGGVHVHARAQHGLLRRDGVENDLDGDSLHHLDEVSRGVFGGQQAQARSGGTGNRVHVARKRFAIHVHIDLSLLS